jgi:hypothetical protein
MQKFLLPIIIFLFVNSCGSSDSSSNTTVTSVDIEAKIELPVSVSTKRAVKNISSEDISRIEITVFDSAETYYNRKNMIKDGNNWSLELYGIPTERDVTFSVEAKSGNSYTILEGNITKELTASTSSVTIPIKVSYEDSEISEPSLKSVVQTDGNTETTITFTLKNPNSDILNWKLIPDPSIVANSSLNFTPIDGTLNSDSSISGNVDFSTLNTETAEVSIQFSGDVGNMVYSENSFILTNVIEDQTETTFSIYSPRDEVSVSLAPILDNIYVTFDEESIIAKALIYGDFPLLGEWGCKNKLEDLNNFSFSDQSYESLLFHYYETIYENIYTDDYGNEIDVNDTIIYLKETFEDNFTRLMNIDINDSSESLFKELQSQYYDDPDFKELDNLLNRTDFQNMLKYFLGDKSLLIAFKSYYTDTRRTDYNGGIIYILDTYERKIYNFEKFIEFMVDDPSTMLEDFNVESQVFTKNSDYYYTKFLAESDSDKNSLHTFVSKIKDSGFTKFTETFSTSGNTLYDLLKEYYDLPNIELNTTEDDNILLWQRITQKFSKLLDVRIDESMETLLTSLKARYNSETNVDFNNFLTLHENRSFQEFREYYIEYSDPSLQLLSSLQSKYDDTICIPRVEDETIRYSWHFASNPDIEIGATNPLKIPFDGTLMDTILLEANRITIDEATGTLIESKVEYRVDVNIKDYHEQNGNPNSVPVDGNLTIDESDLVDENETIDLTPTFPLDQMDYRFEIVTYPTPLNLTLIYGEEHTISFTASHYMTENFDNDFTSQVLNLPQYVTVEDIERIVDSDTFLVTIKAGETSGEEDLSFILQNSGHADVEQVGITVVPPIVYTEINGVEYEDDESVIIKLKEGILSEIPIYVKSAREGIQLNFTFSGDAGNYYLNNSGESVFIKETDEGLTYTLLAKPDFGTAGTEDSIVVTVEASDEDGNYLGSVAYDILLKSESQATSTYSFADCGTINLYEEGYEYLTATLDTKSGVLPSDLNLSLVSRNIYLERNFPFEYGENVHTTVNLFYMPETTDVLSPLVGEVSIVSKNSFEQIGVVKYSKEAMGREFYVKYLDIVNGEVEMVCEKMSFPMEN